MQVKMSRNGQYSWPEKPETRLHDRPFKHEAASPEKKVSAKDYVKDSTLSLMTRTRNKSRYSTNEHSSEKDDRLFVHDDTLTSPYLRNVYGPLWSTVLEGERTQHRTEGSEDNPS